MIGTAKERLEALDAAYPVWEAHTLWTRFRESARRYPDREYLIFESESYTYRETLEQVELTARGLYAIGVRPGDHVGVLLTNGPEYAILVFALSKLGAVKIPINAAINKDELSYILSFAEVKFLVSRYLLDEGFLAGMPSLRKLVCIGKNRFYQAEKLLYWEELLLAVERVDAEEVERVSEKCQEPEGLSDIMFTSGSTARPKGVKITHDMLLRSAYGTCRARCFEDGRRIYAPTPLFHAFVCSSATWQIQNVP